MSKRLNKAIEVAKATMLGDLRDVLINIQKNPKLTGKPWSELKEGEQREIAGMIENQVRTSIVRAIDIIASEGRKHIKVQLKQVTVKDGLKGVFECSKSHELRHDLMDAQGDNVLVVFTSSEKYLGETGKVKIDKDQKSLPVTTETEEDDNEEHDPETGEVTEEGTPGDEAENEEDGADDFDEDDE